MKALSPDGTKIVAASELVPSHARLRPAAFERNAKGALEFQYDPSGSDMFWDKQFIATNDEGKRIFIDEKGQLWSEDQVILTD